MKIYTASPKREKDGYWIRPGYVEEMVRGDPGMDSSDPNINVWVVDRIYTKEASSTTARQARQWERRVG